MKAATGLNPPVWSEMLLLPPGKVLFSNADPNLGREGTEGLRARGVEVHKTPTSRAGTAPNKLTGIWTQGSLAPQQPQEAGTARSLVQVSKLRLWAEELL